ncbi:MAG: hypothetical protein HYT76_08815 [Deltaproteobacteria bacterium]|nr:hypothetical protein [Deltaproteobacteria bacterium]
MVNPVTPRCQEIFEEIQFCFVAPQEPERETAYLHFPGSVRHLSEDIKIHLPTCTVEERLRLYPALEKLFCRPENPKEVCREFAQASTDPSNPISSLHKEWASRQGVSSFRSLFHHSELFLGLASTLVGFCFFRWWKGIEPFSFFGGIIVMGDAGYKILFSPATIHSAKPSQSEDEDSRDRSRQRQRPDRNFHYLPGIIGVALLGFGVFALRRRWIVPSVISLVVSPALISLTFQD